MSLMDDKGDTREDLKLPSGHDDAEKLADESRRLGRQGARHHDFTGHGYRASALRMSTTAEYY